MFDFHTEYDYPPVIKIGCLEITNLHSSMIFPARNAAVRGFPQFARHGNDDTRGFVIPLVAH